MEHADLKKRIDGVLVSLQDKSQGEEAKSKLAELADLMGKQELVSLCGEGVRSWA